MITSVYAQFTAEVGPLPGFAISSVVPMAGKAGDIVTISGDFKFNWKNAWDPTVMYAPDDVVLFPPSSPRLYLNLVSSKGQAPNKHHSWIPFEKVFKVHFGTTQASLQSISTGTLRVFVPEWFELGPVSVSKYDFKCRTAKLFDRLYSPPTISWAGLEEFLGRVIVKIDGTYFGDVQSVYLGDLFVPFQVNDHDEITLEVPPDMKSMYSGFGYGGFGDGFGGDEVEKPIPLATFVVVNTSSGSATSDLSNLDLDRGFGL